MGKPKRTIEQCQEYASSREGECLSKAYVNEDGPLSWRCKRGHEWKSTAASVIGQKAWCDKCAREASARRRSHTLADCHALAASKGGWCLATEYKNSKTRMPWKCKEGHEWPSSYNSVHNGHWCIDCANERKRRENYLGIEKMNELASLLHGKCHSTHYDNVNSILEWECSDGHRFSRRACNVIAGHWCDVCSAGLSERLCRAILEHLYARPFPRRRPGWLLSAAGKPMELDGYCEDLALAFEYQGIQHYEPVLKFKSGTRRLAEIQERDQRKALICQTRKVTLLVIPYKIAHENLERYIRDELQRLGKALGSWSPLPLLDLRQKGVRADDRLPRVKQQGASKGLECLSPTYLGHDTPLRWRCKSCGDEFDFRPDRLTQVIQPCSHCRKVTQLIFWEQNTRAKIIERLATFGDELISPRFTGQNDLLDVRCKKGTLWQASWASLRHGKRCKCCR